MTRSCETVSFSVKQRYQTHLMFFFGCFLSGTFFASYILAPVAPGFRLHSDHFFAVDL